MASKKDITQLIKELRKQGFIDVPLKSNHTAVYKREEPSEPANGKGEKESREEEETKLIFVTTLPSTPSDHRSILNAMAYLKRAGFVPPNRNGQAKGKKKRQRQS